MEPKIKEVQAMVQESWQRFDRYPQESALIQPVKKGAQSEKAKVGDERSRPTNYAKEASKSKSTLEVSDQIRQYLEEVNVQLSFQINEETGDQIVQVVNQSTGEVIRQIPPEDLVELREKLAELRGVLFNDKV